MLLEIVIDGQSIAELFSWIVKWLIIGFFIEMLIYGFYRSFQRYTHGDKDMGIKMFISSIALCAIYIFIFCGLYYAFDINIITM